MPRIVNNPGSYTSWMCEKDQTPCDTLKIVDICDCPNANDDDKRAFIFFVKMRKGLYVQIRRPYDRYSFVGSQWGFLAKNFEGTRHSLEYEHFGAIATSLCLSRTAFRKLVKKYLPEEK